MLLINVSKIIMIVDWSSELLNIKYDIKDNIKRNQ